MGKRSEQTKKRKRLAGGVIQSVKADAGLLSIDKHIGVPATEINDDQLISLDDLATTVLTLETLCEEPEELARKDVKDVKRAVYALQRVMADGMTLGKHFVFGIDARSLFCTSETDSTSRYIPLFPDIVSATRLPIHRRSHSPVRDVHTKITSQARIPSTMGTRM